MTGQISRLPIELVAVLVAASMLAGAADIIRLPGWAWKQAEESKPAYLILDLLLPVIGLAMYAFRARPKVIAALAQGADPVPTVDPQATTTEPQTEPQTEPTQRTIPTAVATAANPFTGFREVAGNGHDPADTGPAAEEPEPFEVSGTFFSTGAANRTMRHPLALARAYRPRQRTSLIDDDPEPRQVPEPVSEPETGRAHVPVAEPESEPAHVPVGEPVPEPERAPVVAHEAPTVPSGWKVDPTGRHEFRYWDGTHWTENVADDGQESRDAVSA
jgi:hypothetical protein